MTQVVWKAYVAKYKLAVVDGVKCLGAGDVYNNTIYLLWVDYLILFSVRADLRTSVVGIGEYAARGTKKKVTLHHTPPNCSVHTYGEPCLFFVREEAGNRTNAQELPHGGRGV